MKNGNSVTSRRDGRRTSGIGAPAVHQHGGNRLGFTYLLFPTYFCFIRSHFEHVTISEFVDIEG